MYVSSALTGQVLVYQGPLLPDGTPNPNAGRYDGVYANVGTAVKAETGRVNDILVLSGLGFGPDGNLYVGSSFEQPQDGSENAGAPVAGSQWSVVLGPNPGAFGQTGTPGTYLGAYGDANTEVSRLLLPTTPEFTYFSNSYTHYNDVTERFPEIFYVVGVNTDQPFDETTGTPGFFQADQTDAIAAYDRDMNFLGYLGTPLVNGKLGTDITAATNPLSGIGDIVLSASGEILVSSQLTDQILRYNSLTGQYIGVFGDASFAGSGLDFPAGMTTSTVNAINVNDDPSTRSGLFVSDLVNGRILRFDGYTGEFYDDPATADVNEGVLAQLEPEKADWRFTDLAFGPDGRIYVGLNSPLANSTLGSAVIRVYNPENNTLEQEITGFDFVAALTFGPDNRLYVTDDPASLVDATGLPLAPDKESRVVIYNIDYVHPILVDPATGNGSPTGLRSDPVLVNQFNVGVGNGGAISVTNDQATNTPVIFLSQPVAGTVALYTSDGVLQETLNPSLPGAANGVDENGIARPTGSAFLSEFIRQSSYANLLAEVVPNNPPTAVVFSNAIAALTENTDTTGGIKVADISITDDGQGDNTLSLSGSDASSFEIRNNALYYIGNSPDFETKSSYSVTVNVDDITVGFSPDASAIFSLAITNLADQDISEGVTTFDDGLNNDGLGDLAYNLSNTTGDVTTKADDTALSQTNALFHNLVGLYQVENSSGAILDTLDINGNGATDDLLNPSDLGYARTAIANNISNFILEAGGDGDANKNTSASEFGDVLLQGGKFYAPFVIANGGDLIPTGGTLQDGINAFRTQNPENTSATLDNFITHQVAYFSFGMANPDGGVEHLQSRGNNTFGFEDLPGNLNVSDFDFNDSVFKFTFIA